jgi:hypothetical protein
VTLDQTDQIDNLRETLRREAQPIEPVGLGAETVQRRGRHRRHRGRAVVAAGAATCVACLGVAVVQRGETPHSVAVASNAGAATPKLAFRVVNGTVSFAVTHFTSATGVTYALSTAPGVAGQATSANPDQAIYRTRDGEHWSAADQHASWISDLAEHDGVLYAIGTAPGVADADQVTYRVGTSHDDGAAWTDSDLPFDLSAPTANVALNRSSVVQIASGPSATVALLTEQFSPDLDAFVTARAAGHPAATTNQTAAGFDIVDTSACNSPNKQAAINGAADPTARANECTHPPVLGTISWSDIGLRGPSDLFGQQVLVSTDGSHWTSAPGPSNGFVRDLVATDDGFLLLDDSFTPIAGTLGGRSSTKLFSSPDARTWTQVGIPADLTVQAIAGNRIVGYDESGAVHTSADGGTTWNTTDVGALLPAGMPHAAPWIMDAGPLGFAVVVTADANEQAGRRGHEYLLFSTDGTSWSTSDLAAAGAPAGANPMLATVGSDHIGVDYESAGPTPGGPMKITTVLATPTR